MCGTAVGQISTDISAGRQGAAAERHHLRTPERPRHLVAELLHRSAPGRCCSRPCTTTTSTRWSSIDQFHLDAAAGHLARRLVRRSGIRQRRVGGEQRRHPQGRGLRVARGQRGDGGSELGEDVAHLAVRRGRRLLRPRAAAARHRRRTTSRPRSPCRRDLPGGYDRYGFRVPAVIVSPYARAAITSRTACTTTPRS